VVKRVLALSQLICFVPRAPLVNAPAPAPLPAPVPVPERIALWRRLFVLLGVDPWSSQQWAIATGVDDHVLGTRAGALDGDTLPVAHLIFPASNSASGFDRPFRCILFHTFLLVVSRSPLRAIRAKACADAGMKVWQVDCFLHFCNAVCMHPVLLLVGFPTDFHKHKSLSVDLESLPYCAPFSCSSLVPDDVSCDSGVSQVVSGGGFVNNDTFTGPLLVTKVLLALPHPDRASSRHYLFKCTVAGTTIPVNFGFHEYSTATEVVACGLSGLEGDVEEGWSWAPGHTQSFGSASTLFRFRPSFSEAQVGGAAPLLYGNIDVVLQSAPDVCGCHLLHLGALLSALEIPGVFFWDPLATDVRKKAPVAAAHLAWFLHPLDVAPAFGAVACGHLLYLQSRCADLGLSWDLPVDPVEARRRVCLLWNLQVDASARSAAAVLPSSVAAPMDLD
jgi:hypothetical protein